MHIPINCFMSLNIYCLLADHNLNCLLHILMFFKSVCFSQFGQFGSLVSLVVFRFDLFLVISLIWEFLDSMSTAL